MRLVADDRTNRRIETTSRIVQERVQCGRDAERREGEDEEREERECVRVEETK